MATAYRQNRSLARSQKLDPSEDPILSIKATRHEHRIRVNSVKRVNRVNRVGSPLHRPNPPTSPLRSVLTLNITNPDLVNLSLLLKIFPPSTPYFSTLMQLEGDRVGIYSARGLRLDKGFGQVN